MNAIWYSLPVLVKFTAEFTLSCKAVQFIMFILCYWLLTCPKVLFHVSSRYKFCYRLCDTSKLSNGNRVLCKLVCTAIKHSSVTSFITADKMFLNKLLGDTAST